MRKFLMIGATLLVAACSRPAAEVEKVEINTEVGDFGMMVNAIEITVSNPLSIKGLTAADFNLVNNVPGGYMDPVTGKMYEEFTDDESEHDDGLTNLEEFFDKDGNPLDEEFADVFDMASFQGEEYINQ